jgi:hypothetical protein
MTGMKIDGSFFQNVPDENGDLICLRVQPNKSTGGFRPLDAADDAFFNAAIERQFQQDVADYKATMSYIRRTPTGTTKATPIPAKPISKTIAPKPSAAKPSAPANAAKPVNPVLKAFTDHFGEARGSVLYCENGVHKATMADADRCIRQDLQVKLKAKAEADAFNALLKSDNPALSFGATQVAKMKGQVKATPAAQAPSAPVRAEHPYRKVELSDRRKTGRSASADFAAAIAKRMAR